MRKKIIAGNWKMNIKPSETAALVKAVAEATPFTSAAVSEGLMFIFQLPAMIFLLLMILSFCI